MARSATTSPSPAVATATGSSAASRRAGQDPFGPVATAAQARRSIRRHLYGDAPTTDYDTNPTRSRSRGSSSTARDPHGADGRGRRAGGASPSHETRSDRDRCRGAGRARRSASGHDQESARSPTPSAEGLAALAPPSWRPGERGPARGLAAAHRSAPLRGVAHVGTTCLDDFLRIHPATLCATVAPLLTPLSEPARLALGFLSHQADPFQASIGPTLRPAARRHNRCGSARLCAPALRRRCAKGLIAGTPARGMELPDQARYPPRRTRRSACSLAPRSRPASLASAGCSTTSASPSGPRRVRALLPHRLSMLGVEPSHADAELVEWDDWSSGPRTASTR